MILYTKEFLASTLFTITTETLILLLLIRLLFKSSEKEIPNAKLVLSGIFASMATTSYVWYVFPILMYRSYPIALLTGEIFAFVAEAIFYMAFLGLSARRAFAVSFCANSASFFGGRLLRMLFI